MSMKKSAILITVICVFIGTVGIAKYSLDFIKDTAKSYLYGYPLVLMHLTKDSMTTTDRTEINRFSHIQTFPDHEFENVVKPNNDTLYSMAWLDLKEGPVVLSIPAMGDRYFVMPLMDAWTNVFATIGQRTRGGGPGQYLIVGPDWSGKAPGGFEIVESLTNMVWIIGRIQANGKDDISYISKFQSKFNVVSLSDWQKGVRQTSVIRNIDTAKKSEDNPHDTLVSMAGEKFFGILSKLMVEQPPSSLDSEALSILTDIGFHVGRPFKPNWYQSLLLNIAIDLTYKKIDDKLKKGLKLENGWVVLREKIANYGTDYTLRAVIAKIGLGALPPEEASYPSARYDANGAILNGKGQYKIHFPAGKTPPVNAFWSLTMYNKRGFLVNNSIKRYTIGDRDNLIYNADGSLDIYFQVNRPDNKPANWLPTPEGDFSVMLRIYSPKQEFLKGKWLLPKIKKIN